MPVSWKRWHRLSREYGKLTGHSSESKELQFLAKRGENLLQESFHLPPQGEVLNAISSQTQILSGSLHWSCVWMWRGDPSETSFTNNNNNKAEHFKDKKIMGWKSSFPSCRLREPEINWMMGKSPFPHEGPGPPPTQNIFWCLFTAVVLSLYSKDQGMREKSVPLDISSLCVSRHKEEK